MIGLLIVIAIGVCLGIRMAQPVDHQPIGIRFVGGFLSFLMWLVIVCGLLIAFVCFMQWATASAAGLPGIAQQDWDAPGWEGTPVDAVAVRRLPDAMLGPWCPLNSFTMKEFPETAGNTYVRGSHAQMQRDPACIMVTPTGYRGIEDSCEFMSVKHWSDVYLIRMKCSEGEDVFPPTSSTFQIIDGKLSVRGQT